jgi:hypothetical protein
LHARLHTSPTPRRLLRLAAGLFVSLLAIALTCAAPGAAGAAEAGVNVAGPTAEQIGGARTLGVKWVRMFVSWRGMEPSRGVLNEAALRSYEQGFAQLAPGNKVILDVVGTPQWESGSSDEHAPPANPQDYAEFVAAMAHRLAPWVSAYEIWNEEDEPRWWTGAPDPAAYVRLLQATYPAIKAADPAATVVLGGLTGNDYPFLEGIYAAGGKGYFDAVGVHTDTACNVLSPYDFLRDTNNRLIPDSFLAYREVHAVEVANGDDKPIWMTEMSWRTTSAVCAEGVWAGQKAAGVSDAQQATYLQQAYHCLAENSYVQVALWYLLQDEGPVTSGLLRADGSHKPAYGAMREYVRDGDRLKESCGNFTGPKIEISSPSNHIAYSGPLPIHVAAVSREGVFRVRLEIDGKLIRNYDGKTYPTVLSGRLTWQGAKHIAYGRHTLTFLAYDKQRNVSQRSITIIHTKPKPKRHRHHH